MIYFFKSPKAVTYAVEVNDALPQEHLNRLSWLFGQGQLLEEKSVNGPFIGPRREMITPWSTGAVEITRNMGISGIIRVEEFHPVTKENEAFDHMTFQRYETLDQSVFSINIHKEDIQEVHDIATYNQEEGLAMNEEEVEYLNDLSRKLGRKLTDSEVFAFSQANSEHCRHKIFNGTFIIDGQEKPESLFKLIKKTTKTHPNQVISAYKDNVAFIAGPKVTQFAPATADKPDFYKESEYESVISLKAETHNFPTTVEPFSGAATGSGGEIRDRLAGGQGALPLAGTAVYMTAYPRMEKNRIWEQATSPRPWLYQTPLDILIKATNGAADFGNKFGQPLITGSILTFEHQENDKMLGYDKVIMQAGGIGYGKKEYALKHTPKKGDHIVVMGGDNYRIGMGGAAVSSADTGSFGSGIELNAIQRSNPEMQKRVANAIRGLIETGENPIVSIHDHGAGGHLNCLSELVEDTGGHIDIDKLPVGDNTLSYKEIIGNESQERMGLVIAPEDLPKLQKVADREQAPLFVVGEVSDDKRFSFASNTTGEKPLDYDLNDFFGASPKTIMEDAAQKETFSALQYDKSQVKEYIKTLLQIEAVASKDWIVNKVDRCVSGRVAKQQTAGALQLPLNNVGVMAMDYKGEKGVATSVGHSPLTALIDPATGSRNAIAESLSNLLFAPLTHGLTGVSLSANWMWACNNPGEDARLYEAVQACSDFAIELGINIPTGKDSLSMKQKYKDQEVIAPGTVIISAAAECSDIKNVIEPVLKQDKGSIYYFNLSSDEFKLGGSSFAQILNKIGDQAPDIKDAAYFKQAFNGIQSLINKGLVAAGHDVGSGGLITTLLELCFAETDLGADYNLSAINQEDIVKTLFNENIGLVLQATENGKFEEEAKALGLKFVKIGDVKATPTIDLKINEDSWSFDVEEFRDQWFYTSYLFDSHQTLGNKAKERFDNYKKQPLNYKFPANFTGKAEVASQASKRPIAAVLREKGSNSEREMANALYLAGFQVKDVHMSDLISGRETLDDVQFLAAVGGFSNSDVLGSAKGWAGSFLFNDKAQTALQKFFSREDTLSLGVCNGCQLFMELHLINTDLQEHGKMAANESGKHECSFIAVEIPENNSVMLSSLAGSQLGVWISNGEGKYDLQYSESDYHIAGKYAYSAYPANPNGSSFNTAMMSDPTGRHLVSMPHIERSIYQWNWPHYIQGRQDEVTPWMEAFINAREWIEKNSK